MSFIASLPPPKRQPNLLFAAARYLLGVPLAIGPLRELASQSRAELTQVMLTRRTQTNEPPGVVPGTDGPARDGQTCVLARDGNVIALTESHATWLRWLPTGSAPRSTCGTRRDFGTRLLDGDRVGGRADPARRVQRRADQEHLVDAVRGA
jgi:hypothetical protein